MEIFLLVFLFLSEILCAMFCIISKSNQQKVRSIFRISLFFTFGLMIITSLIHWNFRWYGFACLLLIWAILGTISLFRKNQTHRTFNRRRIIGNAIFMSLLALITLTPALIFPQYSPLKPTGKFDVETKIDTYIDSNRIETYSDANQYRKITVQYWFPKTSNGKFPLLIFSHGSFGIRTSNLSLYKELASNGYVVCSIDHTYQSLFSTDIEGNLSLLDKGFFSEVISEDAHTNKQLSFEYYQKWMGIRASDINFVIEHIIAKTNSGSKDTVLKLVNPSRIGLMGHSLGGSAVLSVARMRNDVDAVMALESPFLGDIVGVKNDEFVWNEETFPIPILNIYSDSTWDRLEDLPQYAENADLLTNDDAISFNIHFKGARHMTLTDLALSSPFLTRVIDGQRASMDARYSLTTINKLAVEFFDCYLKNICPFSSNDSY